MTILTRLRRCPRTIALLTVDARHQRLRRVFVYGFVVIPAVGLLGMVATIVTLATPVALAAALATLGIGLLTLIRLAPGWIDRCEDAEIRRLSLGFVFNLVVCTGLFGVTLIAVDAVETRPPALAGDVRCIDAIRRARLKLADGPAVQSAVAALTADLGCTPESIRSGFASPTHDPIER